MNKEEILRKLHSQFSYLAAEIPTEVIVEGERVELREKIDKIVATAKHGDVKKILPDLIQLEKALDRLVSEYRNAVENSKIQEGEAASKLDYYLGVKRAITVLRGISDESLKSYSEEDKKQERREDMKRWLNYAKKAEEE